MKKALFLSLFFAQSAMALPIVCESLEKTNEISSLRTKINPKKKISMNGSVWDLHVLGITAQESGFPRHIMYGSGVIRPETVSLTILKDGAVYGYTNLKSPEQNGVYEGKIRIGGILRGRVMDVKCHDEEIHGQM